MGALAGVLNHHLTAGQALTKSSATPMATTTGGTASTGSADSSDNSGSDSATISANDFLTLLVTEMQNQDPTADTDPNEYINQLVQVNSLEQLIDINQNLTTALGDSSSSPTTQASGAAASATGKTASVASPQSRAAAQRAGALPAARSAASATGTAGASAARANHAPGNLSVPGAKPAAHRVAHALDGQSRTQSTAGGLSRGQ